VVLIGKDARLIESAIKAAHAAITHAGTMAGAVQAAYASAVPGDAVLLSPACASFDMFRNYHHRGEVFAQCVADLKQRVEGANAV
jgi:UDP-N-acetylmuramoylalanine--D-glutamate ligase